MAFDGDVQGKWFGRLVDVRGFEGDITLNLKQDGKSGEITGTCDAAIGTNHTSSTFYGEVRGDLTKDRLKLSVQADKQGAVIIHLDGQVGAMKEGGAGLKGTYGVAARGFSPLHGGIICASLNKPITAVTMATEMVVKPTKAQAAAPTKKARRKS